VIDTLKDVEAKQPDRKCFRLVGGVLVERTVKDVLPALEHNRENVSRVWVLLAASETEARASLTCRACADRDGDATARGHVPEEGGGAQRVSEQVEYPGELLGRRSVGPDVDADNPAGHHLGRQ
jgi:Prefoldin subunit